jgi:NADPH:quinone reductase-like Zn-dependent oxidoreductase
MTILEELLELGKVAPVIGSVYAFSRAREAFRHLMEDERPGTIILTPDGTAA